MRAPLSALTFNYNPKGRGSEYLLLCARSFSSSHEWLQHTQSQWCLSRSGLCPVHTQWVELLPAALGIFGMDQYGTG